jgi:hypothetical protein
MYFTLDRQSQQVVEYGYRQRCVNLLIFGHRPELKMDTQKNVNKIRIDLLENPENDPFGVDLEFLVRTAQQIQTSTEQGSDSDNGVPFSQDLSYLVAAIARVQRSAGT